MTSCDHLTSAIPIIIPRLFSAIKIGRYTIDHKTNNIREAKHSKDANALAKDNQDKNISMETIIETAFNKAHSPISPDSPHAKGERYESDVNL